MKKENLNRYVFTEDELKQALGIEGKIEYVFHSIAYNTLRIDTVKEVEE